MPGVVSGSLLVFRMAVSAYTTPAILGGNRVLVMATYAGALALIATGWVRRPSTSEDGCPRATTSVPV